MALACAATLLAAVHRSAFAVLAVPIQAQFGFSLAEMGVLQSGLLFGYLCGQIPSGLAADRVGGARLLMLGFLAWSLASTSMAAAGGSAAPFAFILLSRAALGLGQSCMMPVRPVGGSLGDDRGTAGARTLSASAAGGTAGQCPPGKQRGSLLALPLRGLNTHTN